MEATRSDAPLQVASSGKEIDFGLSHDIPKPRIQFEQVAEKRWNLL
ncbi:MAG TPA: hypothetical protein VNX26_02225 [Candidatus Acidoferrum sp.]|jgi:hypothetical protein|nr:hypothetical protein [Candidatus Acidoferrum sp.]